VEYIPENDVGLLGDSAKPENAAYTSNDTKTDRNKLLLKCKRHFRSHQQGPASVIQPLYNYLFILQKPFIGGYGLAI